MGRIFTIRRAAGKPALSAVEIERCVNNDASLDRHTHATTVYWTDPSGQNRWISSKPDELWTEDVRGDDEGHFFNKLQSIARSLDAQVFESKRIDPALPSVLEARRIIQDPELCHSSTKVLASFTLLEECEDDPNVTVEDMLR